MSGRVPSRGSDQFNLRFPDGMRERIRAAAEESGRSMNAEIIYRLQTTLEMDEYVPQENFHPDEPPRISRSFAGEITAIVIKALIEKGWQPPADQEGTRPEDLNASNDD